MSLLIFFKSLSIPSTHLPTWLRKSFQDHFWPLLKILEKKNQVYDSVIVLDEWKLCVIEKCTLRWARSFFSESSQTPSPYVTLTRDNYMSALFCSYFANIPLLSHNFSTATSKQDFKIWPAW